MCELCNKGCNIIFVNYVIKEVECNIICVNYVIKGVILYLLIM